ncbi:MAG: hypothetical protein BJ554DRAFT_2645 [Olpidium bornovanus]|uniref:S1-like domain-containing protein n=1 Tax=Olpidium bornovanus TaxID=278681 RepID=A0A8H7ZQ43_9FUNG|nr:MAG: hypothetical protein BJ554DRAFT_2645 [Olpidium bornovanus]
MPRPDRRTTQDVLDRTPVPRPPQFVARVLGPRGNNLHLVLPAPGAPTGAASEEPTLVTLPPKFRNTVWVKRGAREKFLLLTSAGGRWKRPRAGHYVIVDPNSERANKLGGEIASVLFPHHVRELKKAGFWPAGFDTEASRPAGPETSAGEALKGSESDDEGLFRNDNRPCASGTESEDGEPAEEEEDDEIDEEEAPGEELERQMSPFRSTSCCRPDA